MKPPKFHAGQAVVCVDATTRTAHLDALYGVIKPKLNAVYHIRAVTLRCHNHGVLLEEIKNPTVPTFCGECKKNIGWHELSFSQARFAPVELLPDEALAQLLEETLAPPVTA